MKRPYLYVEARGWFEERDGQLLQSRELTDDPISFDSVKVEAANAAEAETLGAAEMDTKHIETQDPIVQSHCTGRFLNYYVVAL